MAAHLRYKVLADAHGGYTVEVRSGSAVVEVVSGFPNQDEPTFGSESSAGGISVWPTARRAWCRNEKGACGGCEGL
jgi:hypothetical protein